jgi:unsaturated chondroitin disaccharide hydrolase
MCTQQLEHAHENCVQKIRRNIDTIRGDLREFPATANGDYFHAPPETIVMLRDIGAWTASFYTGMAYWAFRITKDLVYLRWLNGLYGLYHDKVFEHSQDTMHDLGFLYSPYAIALYSLSGDPNQKNIALKAADELAKRFVVNGGYIRAWGRMNDTVPPDVSPERAKEHFFAQSRGLAIIDCMTNLPLLFWASKTTGNPFYRDIAQTHADTTMNLFVRDDYSVYHAYRFDPETGKPVKGCNYCGYADESYWARGAAWAMYGFALAHKYTRRQEYLDTARHLAHAFIEQLDKSIIPVWDFKLPDNVPQNKDTSAASIAVCGFLEILKHDPEDTLLQEWSDTLLLTLTDTAYRGV